VADPVNVGHANETSIAELVAMIREFAGVGPKVEFDLTKPEGAPRKSLSGAKLTRVTGGFVPGVGIRDGLREMVEWYRGNYVAATTTSAPVLSIVTPVYCEDQLITGTVTEIKERVSVPYEMLVVYDFDEDTTLPYVRELMPEVPELRLVKNGMGRGALNAIRTGIAAARGQYIVFVNGDMSDDAGTINAMIAEAGKGSDVVCGTRYSLGGKKQGGPFVQDLLSRMANASFRAVARFPTSDATNSFKLYRADFLKGTAIESSGGFEFSFELAVKARARGLKVVQVPTVWKQRKAGESRFRLVSWLKQYVKWYVKGVLNAWFGRPV